MRAFRLIAGLRHFLLVTLFVSLILAHAVPAAENQTAEGAWPWDHKTALAVGQYLAMVGLKEHPNPVPSGAQVRAATISASSLNSTTSVPVIAKAEIPQYAFALSGAKESSWMKRAFKSDGSMHITFKLAGQSNTHTMELNHEGTRNSGPIFTNLMGALGAYNNAAFSAQDNIARNSEAIRYTSRTGLGYQLSNATLWGSSTLAGSLHNPALKMTADAVAWSVASANSLETVQFAQQMGVGRTSNLVGTLIGSGTSLLNTSAGIGLNCAKFGKNTGFFKTAGHGMYLLSIVDTQLQFRAIKSGLNHNIAMAQNAHAQAITNKIVIKELFRSIDGQAVRHAIRTSNTQNLNIMNKVLPYSSGTIQPIQPLGSSGSLIGYTNPIGNIGNNMPSLRISQGLPNPALFRSTNIQNLNIVNTVFPSWSRTIQTPRPTFQSAPRYITFSPSRMTK